MRMLPIILVLSVLVLITVLSSIFIVDERQQALVLQFGEVKREIRGSPRPDTTTADADDSISVSTGPGLYFKVPLFQEVVYYEDRILPLETSSLEVTPIDDRRLVVNAFARWRIQDPVQFRQAIQTEFAALTRLERILNAALREVLGSVPSDAVLSAERAQLMRRIADVARGNSRNLGVEIVDVRIKRADLPQENLEATYRRMNAEREREAADERARGQERAQEVRATAEREAVELVSDAQRQAEEIRGAADGERNLIYAQAFGRDPEFFAFYRSLVAYERSLRGENSTLVISPDSEFFEYLKNDGAAGSARFGFSPPAVSAAPTAAPEAENAGVEDGDGAAQQLTE
ncbi:MAG: protease modulator HflC [Pseudomonadota bacterium]